MTITITLEDQVPGTEGTVATSTKIAWEEIEFARCAILNHAVTKMKRELDERIRGILCGHPSPTKIRPGASS